MCALDFVVISVYLAKKYILFVSCVHLNVLSNPYAGMTTCTVVKPTVFTKQANSVRLSFVRTGVNHGLCATDGPRLLH